MYDIEEVYKEHYRIVYKYLMCLTNNADLSEELTQETFYKMIKKIDTFKGKAKISVWLCEIAKNLYFDELRKNRKRKKVELDFNNIQSDLNIEEDFIEKEETENISKEIEKLDEEIRRVIFLRLNSDMSFKEIGQVLGGNVKFFNGASRLSVHLKDVLEESNLISKNQKQGKIEFIDSLGKKEKEERFYKFLEEGKL